MTKAKDARQDYESLVRTLVFCPVCGCDKTQRGLLICARCDQELQRRYGPGRWGENVNRLIANIGHTLAAFGRASFE
jgi:hypothetical protein